MEGIIMKLIGLHIKGLYGCYSYDVTFNPDVTFIYGANGCGKTTVLNITEAIITGQLFKLFEYDFDSIVLQYSKSSNLSDVKDIKISYNKLNMQLRFNEQEYIIEKLLNVEEETRSYNRLLNDKSQAYFKEYSVLREIKKTFNYVYLPLNRSVTVYDDDEYIMLRRMRGNVPFGAENVLQGNIRDITMIQVESIIRLNVNRMNSDITEVSDNFRNDILKSLLDVNNQMTYKSLVDCIAEQRNNESNIRQTQNAYIKLLKDLSLISKEEIEYYNDFFANILWSYVNILDTKSQTF